MQKTTVILIIILLLSLGFNIYQYKINNLKQPISKDEFKDELFPSSQVYEVEELGNVEVIKEPVKAKSKKVKPIVKEAVIVPVETLPVVREAVIVEPLTVEPVNVESTKTKESVLPKQPSYLEIVQWDN